MTTKKYAYAFTWSGFGGDVSRIIYDDTFEGAIAQLKAYFGTLVGDSGFMPSVDTWVKSIVRYDNPEYVK